jgi:RNA recognition motif-containing protein
MSIFIGNLAYEVTQSDLNDVFSEYGKVERIHLPTDRETGKMRGFAFIELASPADEQKAINELNQAEWMGRTLKVDQARPRQEGNRGGGRNRY